MDNRAEEHYPVPLHQPSYQVVPAKVVTPRRISLYAVIDGVVAVLAVGLTLWLAGAVLLRGLAWSPAAVVYLIAFWAMLTYLALPRLHQVFTTFYVPDYFIGRTRTDDGLLGDPVNLALDGTAADIHAAMRRAGWTLADELTLRTAWGIVVSSLTRRSYPAAPVSGLHLFGRRHAFAYQQEVDGNAAQRHHVRFWPVPEGWLLPGGHGADWLAAGTYDRAVGLSAFTGQITHKIDADIDVERDYIINTVRWADPGVGIRVIREFSTAYHHRNGGGDLIRTDGHLPVLNVRGAAARSPEPPPPAPARREHALPPLPLLAVTLLWALQVAVLILFGVVLVVARRYLGDVPSEAWTDMAIQGTVILVGAALCAGTIARSRWCRLLLMLLCTVQTASSLADTVSDLSAATLISCSISVLVLLAISSDEVRSWVSRGRADPQVPVA